MLRCPLSGRNGGAGTCGDCYEPRPDKRRDNLYVEIKHYASNRIPGGALFKDTKAKAKAEKRTPVIVMHEKGTRNRFVILDFETFCALLDKAEGITDDTA